MFAHLISCKLRQQYFHSPDQLLVYVSSRYLGLNTEMLAHPLLCLLDFQ